MAPVLHGVDTSEQVRSGSAVTPVAAAVFAATTLMMLGLYLRTMAPTVYGLDSAELTAGAYTLGIVHAPGSPTFLLLGWLFTWLPFGDIGYRVNLLSATSAALSVGFIYGILWQLTRRPLLAAAGAFYVGTTYYVWISALAAELYALHLAFASGLIWLGLVWRQQRRPWQLLLLAFLFGIGTGNHLTLAVLAPGFAVLVATPAADLWRRPRLVAGAVACAALGWAIYLYLPLRAAAGVEMNYARDFGVDAATWDGFWWMVSGSMFSGQLFAVPLTTLPAELAAYLYRLWSNFVGLGCLLGPVGLWVGMRRRPYVHLSLLLMFLGHLFFVLTYDVADKELMLLPTFLIWGLWSVLGAERLTAWANRRSGGSLGITGAMLLLIMAAGNVVLNYTRVDVSEDYTARMRGELLMRWLPTDSLYLATWADAPIVDFFQQVERRRPDVDLVNIFLVRGDRRRALVERQLSAGKAVYATTPVQISLPVSFDLVESCMCYRLSLDQAPSCLKRETPGRCEPAPSIEHDD